MTTSSFFMPRLALFFSPVLALCAALLAPQSLAVPASQPLTPAVTAEANAPVPLVVRDTPPSAPLQVPAHLRKPAPSYDVPTSLAGLLSTHSEQLFNSVTSPQLGAANPKLTLVLFTDYDCRYCKLYDQSILRLLAQYPHDLAVVIKLLPFKGSLSVKASAYSLTMWQQQQSGFLPLHRSLMDSLGRLDAEKIEQALIKSGNVALRADPSTHRELAQNLRLAQRLGIQGTPATLIGSSLISGALPYAELELRVKAALTTLQ
ncbi:MAG: DsbA family protein [Aeromonas sp.]